MKARKATGVDEIPTECLKALDTTSLKILKDLFNKIYRTGYIPNESGIVNIHNYTNETKGT